MHNTSLADQITVVDGCLSSSVDARDRGLAYGHGVFETMLLAAGELPLWSYHRERLGWGLSVLGIPCDDNVIATTLRVLLDTCPTDGVVKLTVTAGISSRGYTVAEPLVPTIIAQWSPARSFGAIPVSLEINPYRLPLNPMLAGIKHLNRLDQVMAASKAASSSLPLLLDVEGRVIEGLSHNIFAYHSGVWLTPDLSRCGVAGVMREMLIKEIFPDLGHQVAEAPFEIGVLSSADELFVCNSIRGIQPVSDIVGVRHFENCPETGRITTQLSRKYPCFTVR